MKFKPTADDEVNGNNLVYRCLGTNAGRRHKHFRRFLCVKNPTKQVPSRYVDPNFKIREFVTHVQNISMEAWMLGVEISVDKQTLKFQGRHIDKLQITYKREGDGFHLFVSIQE